MPSAMRCAVLICDPVRTHMPLTRDLPFQSCRSATHVHPMHASRYSHRNMAALHKFRSTLRRSHLLLPPLCPSPLPVDPPALPALLTPISWIRTSQIGDPTILWPLAQQASEMRSTVSVSRTPPLVLEEKGSIGALVQGARVGTSARAYPHATVTDDPWVVCAWGKG